MKKPLALATLALALASASAQNSHDGTVALLELRDQQALFSVQVDVDKKGDLEQCAGEALVYLLLTQGVEGIHDGHPLMEKENKYWLNNTFFKGKNAPYLRFIKGCTLEDEPVKTPSEKFRGAAYILLNYEALVRQLKAYGIMNK